MACWEVLRRESVGTCVVAWGKWSCDTLRSCQLCSWPAIPLGILGLHFIILFSGNYFS